MPTPKFVPLSSIGKQIYAEGRNEGRREGQRGLLIRQLTRRFGPLPAAAMSRIQIAGPEQLES